MTVRRATGIALLVGVIAWPILWFQTFPRANYDSLIYHADAFEYAGLAPGEADAQSWTIYARYANPVDRSRIEELRAGVPWRTPDDGPWMGLYHMRPLYPLLVAAGYPFLGPRSPMAASALVTVGYVLVTVVGFGVLFGYRVAALATVAALLQVNFTRWLVFLATDGLAMTLWAASLVAMALWVRGGSRWWLVVVAISAFSLALARPNASLAPLVPLVCMAAALVARRPVWRRFGAATVATAMSAAVVIVAQQAMGFPGITEVLQEIPTRHLALPFIDDPIGYIIRLNQWAIPNRLLPTLLGQPLLLATVTAGFAGLVVHRSWTAAIFLVAALIAQLAWVIHPVWYDAGRIMAPAWVALSLGVALLAEWALVRWREPIRAAVAAATRPAAPAG